MKTRTLASTLMLLSLAALTAVAVAPTASAHTCESRVPSDCGPCTPPGPHAHYVYVSDNTKVLWCVSTATDIGAACDVLGEFGIETDCDGT
jgi:hypothetical protein